MKKNLLTIGLLALGFAGHSQNVLLHLDETAKMYVSKGTLVYNGGGLQTKGSGANTPTIENHGDFMIVGSSTDLFRNLNSSGAVESAGVAGTFINKLNEENNVNLVNPVLPPTSAAPLVYTYGQLYIDGIEQNSITGVINEEFRQPSHGAYQQMGFPFYDKTISSLSGATGLGKTFNNNRYSGNEILYWNNSNVVSANLPNGLNTRLGVDLDPFAYFIVGGTGLNVSTQTRTLSGRPVATLKSSGIPTLSKQLTGAGAGIATFGANGTANNQYNEHYNTYLQDSFSTSGGTWVGNFGRNFYQFGNPYLTNLDLSQIAVAEANGDGNYLSNIYGVRLEVQGVNYTANVGGGSTTFKYLTFDASGTAVGDVAYGMVRPMGTFVIKLKDNLSSPETLNFASLRRFNYHPRQAATPYSVSAAKNTAGGTVKQLGVIGLDANGNEVDRTYYVVSANTVSGHTSNPTVQVTASNSFGTFEEDPVNGGYDSNYFSYWLYINEANELNFKGKNIKLVNYNPNIVSFKFEVRENASEIASGTHVLSSGESFYFKKGNETSVSPAVNGQIVASQAGNNNGVDYDLYYGLPSSSTLTTNETKKQSRTLVVYNSNNNGYFVRFDPSWKKADIEVFDMSGKLVLSKKQVDASRDYDLDLAKDLKVGYLVTIISDKGEVVNSKIVK